MALADKYKGTLSNGCRDMVGNNSTLNFQIYPTGKSHRLYGLYVVNPTNRTFFLIGRGSNAATSAAEQLTAINKTWALTPGVNEFTYDGGLNLKVTATLNGTATTVDGLYVSIAADDVGTQVATLPAGWAVIGFYK